MTAIFLIYNPDLAEADAVLASSFQATLDANDGVSTVSFPDDVKVAYEVAYSNTTNVVVVNVPETSITCTDVLGGKSV